MHDLFVCYGVNDRRHSIDVYNDSLKSLRSFHRLWIAIDLLKWITCSEHQQID